MMIWLSENPIVVSALIAFAGVLISAWWSRKKVSKTDATIAITTAATEVVSMLKTELASVRADLEQCRTHCDECRKQLSKLIDRVKELEHMLDNSPKGIDNGA